MQIPERGQGRDEVLEELKGYRDGDISWRDGKALAYVFHADEEAAAVGERAYQMYLWENALDPTIFPSLMRFETEIVAMAAHHLGGDDQVVGNFTSGGTESVLLAVKTARDYARANRPDLGRPHMVLPVTAHPCFHKAAHYFELDTTMVPVDPQTMKADAAAMREAITDDTVLLVGSSPSYAHGVVDPIREIGQVALEHNLLFHVDGCIGGFLLPFMRDVGEQITDFDFSVPGVTSMSMDLHKYAYCPKGASVVLYRNADIRRHQFFTWSAWPGYSMVNPTVQSSKSGGPLAAAWAVLNYFGREGYLRIAEGLAESRKRVIAGIEAIDDLYIQGDPEMTLFAVGSDTVNLFRLCDEMKRRGWTMHPQLQLGEMKPSFHINLIPINGEHIDNWLAELARCVEDVKADKSAGGMTELRQALEFINFDKLDDKGIEALLELAGLGGGDLPGDDVGEVFEILNDLPHHIIDRVLAIYFNKLSRYKPPK